jgi:hypothetical protein
MVEFQDRPRNIRKKLILNRHKRLNYECRAQFGAAAYFRGSGEAFFEDMANSILRLGAI